MTTQPSKRKPNIDWDFIRQLEGFELTGYVPKDMDANDRVPSGVTIVGGFDLGQHSVEDLVAMQVPDTLLLKLAKYTKRTGKEARALLKQQPLILTKEEGVLLDDVVKAAKADLVVKEYNDNSQLDFLSLPRATQTVITSVAFQYGSLKKKTPNFFRSITTGEWGKAHNQLMNFGDSYKPRRQKEAALLRTAL